MKAKQVTKAPVCEDTLEQPPTHVDGPSDTTAAAGQGPDLGLIDARLASGRAILDDPAAPLLDDERAELGAAIEEAQSQLAAYKTLSTEGQSRATLLGGIGAAAGAVVADDVTGFGVGDDPLLVLLGLAALVALVATRPSTPSEALGRAWMDVDTSVRVVARLGIGLVALRINGEKIRGNAERLAEHLARLLGLSAVAGVASGEPPGNGDDDGHWWKEIKAFLKNIRDAMGDASRRQVLRELHKRFTPEQVAEMEQSLIRAAKKLGETPPEFLP